MRETESKIGVDKTFIVYLDFERVDKEEAKRILSLQKVQNGQLGVEIFAASADRFFDSIAFIREVFTSLCLIQIE